MIVKNLEEFFTRACNEFIEAGFEEYQRYNDNLIEYHLEDKFAMIGLHNDNVQIYLTFSHDWSESLFPCRAIMSVLGNSLFYYGELIDNE